MTAKYTVLIPPTWVTKDEADFVKSYRRANRINTSETLRRFIAAYTKCKGEYIIEEAAYGSLKAQINGFLVDDATAHFISELAYVKDTSKGQIVRSAIDYMKNGGAT